MFGKIYPCDLCKKTFSRNGDLTRHKAIHSGEKNHVCVVCGMRFAQHSGLKTHQNTHTGEKPHRCDYCGKAFGDPSSCARHEKEKHFGKPFQCRWCPSSIVRRSSFAGHLKEKHPEIRHMVTKEFLDELEGPRTLKPKNKRGRNRRSVTSHEPRTPVTTETGFYNCPHTTTTEDDELMLSQQPVPDYQTPATYQHQLQHSHQLQPQPQTQPQTQPQPQPQFQQQSHNQQQQTQEHHPVFEPLNFNYGGMYTGPPQYDDGGSGSFDTRSVSSSPGPITPLDVKPPAFVEPSKINPYDFSMFGTEGQTGPQFVAPPLYSYVPEQRDLLYYGF